MKIIKDNVSKDEYSSIDLNDNQFFALMVEDDKGFLGMNSTAKTLSDELESYGYNIRKQDIGLECNSDRRIYISKYFFKRYVPIRGRTVVVETCLTDRVYEIGGHHE